MLVFYDANRDNYGLMSCLGTPAMRDRGQEVCSWLEQQQQQAAAAGGGGRVVESFCILDDEHAEAFHHAGLSANLVRTFMRDEDFDQEEGGGSGGGSGNGGGREGLTRAKADEAIAILLGR